MPTAHRHKTTGRLSEIHRGKGPPVDDPETHDVVRLARMPEGRGPWSYDPATHLAVPAPPSRKEALGTVEVPRHVLRSLCVVAEALASRMLLETGRETLDPQLMEAICDVSSVAEACHTRARESDEEKRP